MSPESHLWFRCAHQIEMRSPGEVKGRLASSPHPCTTACSGGTAGSEQSDSLLLCSWCRGLGGGVVSLGELELAAKMIPQHLKESL